MSGTSLRSAEERIDARTFVSIEARAAARSWLPLERIASDVVPSATSSSAVGAWNSPSKPEVMR